MSQYLWYFLLAEGLQESRGLYVMPVFDATAVEDYVRHGIPIELEPVRGVTPPGLTVHGFLAEHERELVRRGLVCTPLPSSPGIWSVSIP